MPSTYTEVAPLQTYYFFNLCSILKNQVILDSRHKYLTLVEVLLGLTMCGLAH